MIHYEKIVEILKKWQGYTVTGDVRANIAEIIMAEIPTPQTTGDSELRDKLAMLYLKKQDKLPFPDAPNRVDWINHLAEEAYQFADEFIKNIPNE